jgi:hypothetical protein
VTAVTVSVNGNRPAAAAERQTAAQRQAVARHAYVASVAAGTPLSGTALARQFDMSERWGRNIVAEARQAGTNGNRQANRSAPPRSRERNTAGREGPAQTREPGTETGDVPATIRDERPAPAGTAAPGRQTPPAVRHDDPSVAGEPAAATAATAAPTATEGRRSWQDSLITLTVAVVAAAASYGHMFEVAHMAGEPLWLARAFPVTVDGLVLASLRRGPQGRWWLRLGVAVSVAANVLSRYPDLAATAGPVVSAWPPLALYGTHRLLHGRFGRGGRS